MTTTIVLGPADSGPFTWPVVGGNPVPSIFVTCRGPGGKSGVSASGEGGGGGGSLASGTVTYQAGVSYSVGMHQTSLIPGEPGHAMFMADGVEVILARGGRDGNGRLGGKGGSVNDSIGDNRYPGGDGADSIGGGSDGGGGGGSGASDNSPGFPGHPNHGTSGVKGGFGASPPLWGGKGGNGGDNGQAGLDGGNPGGGGGGGGAGANGGAGGPPQIIIAY